MAVPYRHVADYTDLTADETAEIAALTQAAMRTLRAVSAPHGFNIGHEPGRGRRRRDRRPPASARRAALGRRHQLHADHRAHPGAAAVARRHPRAAREAWTGWVAPMTDAARARRLPARRGRARRLDRRRPADVRPPGRRLRHGASRAATSSRASSTPTATSATRPDGLQSRSGRPGRPGDHQPRRRRAADSRRRVAGRQHQRPAARRPAAADPGRPPHRPAAPLHPRPRGRGRAGRISSTRSRARPRRGDGWVKIAADWIDRSIGDLAPVWPDDVLAEAVRRAHELGVRVAAHVFGEDALPGLIAAGIDSIEHGTGLTADLLDEVARRGHRGRPDADQHRQLPGDRGPGGGQVPGLPRPHAGAVRDLARPDPRGLGGRDRRLHRHGRRRVAAARPGAGRDPGPGRGRHPAGRGHRPGVLARPRVAGPARVWTRARRPTWSPTPTTRGSSWRPSPSPRRTILRGAVVA